MKNLIITLFILSLTNFYSFTQDIEAPVNPEFLKYMQNKSSIDYDEIPMYVLPNFNNYINNKNSRNVQFETSYDLRIENLVTEAKSQGACGCCWTFATFGAIESYWLKQGYGEFDLSEQNMRTCHGFYADINGSCTGGNPKKSAAYLTRRDGPILEIDDTYNTDETETCTNGYTPVAYVDDLRIFPRDETTLKQAILDYGALYVNMYYSSDYLNESNYSYYYDGTEGTNHAVLLAGWNDTITTDGGTGAWIIRNSYGTDFGDNGYFYLSYSDAQALSTNACFPSHNEYDSLETIYMYNELGWLSNTGYSSETAYGLTKFIANADQIITKIGTYVSTAGAELVFDIYDNKDENTLSNLLSSYTPPTCEFPGYYSFSLPSGINIDMGNDFYVQVRYFTPGYNYPIPFEKYIAEYADPSIEVGVCWIGSAGTSWSAIGNDIEGKERDLCIRAYAIPNTTNLNVISNIDFDFIIYPIPAKNTLNIDFNQKIKNNISCTIFDISGKEIYKNIKTNFSGNQLQLDISEFSKGIYFLKINNINRKFIID